MGSSEEDQQDPVEKSCYYGPQQPDEPPPTYGVAVNMNAAEAGLKAVEFGVLEFGEQSVKMDCSACHHQISTNVDSQVRQSGWMFALLCCICGSWLISLLVCCLPGFRKYSHYCPHCRCVVISKGRVHLLSLMPDCSIVGLKFRINDFQNSQVSQIYAEP